MQTIKPARRFIFAKPVKEDAQTKSGILLPQNSVDKPYLAEVINTGEDVEWLRAEDQIVYKPYTATEIKLDQEDYILIDAEDVLGVIKDVVEETA